MNRSLIPIIALVIALPVALWLGTAVAQDQATVLLWIAGTAFVTLCFALGRHVWILIPGTVGMLGGINAIPGSPTPWQFMTLTVAFIYLLRIATRRMRPRLAWNWMDTTVFLVFLSVLQAFIMNPTGLAIFGGDYGGGKPYFHFAMAFAAFWLIGLAEADVRTWRWAVIAFIAGTLLDSLIAVAGDIFPQFAGVAIRFYSNVSFASAMSVDYANTVTEGRIAAFGYLGVFFGLCACSFWRPLATLDIRRPWRIVIALLGAILTLLSGFRSKTALLVVYGIVGTIVRRKYADLLILGAGGTLALIALLALLPSRVLPYSVERVLSAIPGAPVRSDVKSDSDSSNNIRFEMWRMVLSSDRYIKNKLLGDGFNLSADELAARQAVLQGDFRGVQNFTMIDHLLVSGSYHGFHVETIRFTGIVGLFAATAAMVAFAIYGNRCIRATYGQADFGYVVFFCMPYLVYPWWLWLIFGAYRNEFPSIIAAAGMIKLLYVIQRRDALALAGNSETAPQSVR